MGIRGKLFVCLLLCSLFSLPAFALSIPTVGTVSRLSNGSVNFSWMPVAGAASYYFEGYLTDSNNHITGSPLFQENRTAQEANCNASICSYAVSVGSSVNTGAWKIRAIDANSQKSNYSEYTYFSLTPTPTPTVPEPIAPKENQGSAVRQSDGTVNFTWKPVANAEFYSVVGYATNSDRTINWSQGIPPESVPSAPVTPQQASCTLSSCSYAMPVSSGINTATWKVRAIFANNVKGDYSSYTPFTLTNTPPSPINEPLQITHSYQVSTDNIRNPERGVFGQPSMDENDLGWYADTQHSLVSVHAICSGLQALG